MALTAFILNLIWEILHSKLYFVSGGSMPWFYLWFGTVIDVVYVLALYFIVALLLSDKAWIFKLNFKRLILMGFLGVLLAIVNEAAALALNLWQYAPSMPLLLARVGLSPVLQMALLAPLSILLSSGIIKKIKTE